MNTAYKATESLNIRSTRKFGVELETASCPNYHDCNEKTMFVDKYDGSITGREFISPACYGDADFRRIVEFCRFANGRKWTVDKQCGFHVHIDVTHESDESLRRIAKAYYQTAKVWQSFVPKARRSNYYCKDVQWTPDSMGRGDFGYWADNQDRYAWFNVASYGRHGTFEVRLHSATLDANKVCNWVAAHTRFVDWVACHTQEEVDSMLAGNENDRFAAICEIIGAELGEYYRERAKRFGTEYAE